MVYSTTTATPSHPFTEQMMSVPPNVCVTDADVHLLKSKRGRKT